MTDRAPSGLREIKKQRTRETIAAAALDLFLERGFDAVPVSEVARAAEVSDGTVFNYFRTKEDLVFNRLDQFWDRLLDAVERRVSHVGVTAAVEQFLLAQTPNAQTIEQKDRLLAITRMITDSHSLLARERASYDQAANSLAAVIARTTPLRADALAAAQMILGVHRSLVAYTREQVLSGAGGSDLALGVADRTRSGYALLRSGLTI